MNPDNIPQTVTEPPVERPRELWQITLDKIAEIKSRAVSKATAAYKDLQREDWEPEAVEFLAKNPLLCDVLYRKYWWDYAKTQIAVGRKISSIRTAEEPGDCPSDDLYPLVNVAILKRGNNTAFINQILDEYEEAYPAPRI